MSDEKVTTSQKKPAIKKPAGKAPSVQAQKAAPTARPDVQMAETAAHNEAPAQRSSTTSTQARPASPAHPAVKPEPKKTPEEVVLKILKEGWQKIGLSGKVLAVLIVLGIFGKLFNYF